MEAFLRSIVLLLVMSFNSPVLAKQLLNIGFADDYPPFYYLNAKGEPEGISYECNGQLILATDLYSNFYLLVFSYEKRIVQLNHLTSVKRLPLMSFYLCLM